jgi:isoaspartyl peptidase/L-asparaginase-like protein (Ntn-hydrolase superfamily)
MEVQDTITSLLRLKRKSNVVSSCAVATYASDSSPSSTDTNHGTGSACKRSWTMLNQDVCALDVVQEAVKTLEDDPCLNAGSCPNFVFVHYQFTPDL